MSCPRALPGSLGAGEPKSSVRVRNGTDAGSGKASLPEYDRTEAEIEERSGAANSGAVIFMYAIAIDGPAGAGKSYLAKTLAARLSYIYVDTGALYRSIGLYVCRKGLRKEDREGIVSCLPEISLSLSYREDGQHVLMNGEDVSSDIRLPEISMYASAVSAIPEVRSFLIDLQRDMAQRNNVIMDGRDIGTVILPRADVKIFLTASDEVRAGRRYRELCAKGVETTLEEVLRDMQSRDQRDRTRAVAPAVPAADAVILDNSLLDEEQTVQAALEIIRKRTGEDSRNA